MNNTAKYTREEAKEAFANLLDVMDTLRQNARGIANKPISHSSPIL